MSDFGVVVVTYNSAAEIGHCLEALQRCGAPPTVVVDNASTDDTPRMAGNVPFARLVRNSWNRGFAAAANQGIGLLDRDCVLLLNPDARVSGGLAALAVSCSHATIAAAGGRLIDSQGQPQEGFMVRGLPTAWTLAFEVLGLNRMWPGNPINRRYRCQGIDPNRPAEVEQPAGAFLMIRRSVWRQLGGFDEAFHPLWFEDVDFCQRARAAGLRVRYEPAAVAIHRGGHSVQQLSCGNRMAFWYGTLLLYAAKHFGPAAARLLALAVVVGTSLRAIVSFVRGSPHAAVAAAGVIGLAGRVLRSGRSGSRIFLSASAER